jgi:hypothetical protein
VQAHTERGGLTGLWRRRRSGDHANVDYRGLRN